MEKWRCIFGAGSISGIVLTVIDSWIEPIPYEIAIPIQIVSIVLIFAGLIMRKGEQARETR